jgi:hypothetical protein
MRKSMKWGGLGLAALLASGCGAPEAETEAGREAQAQGEAPAGTEAADTAVYVATPERELLPSHRIYYTLTDHEWYARGEPLLHEGRAFHATGVPVAASSDRMNLLGEYQGVEFYAMEGDGAGTLFVPVFEGYWQPFRMDAAAVRPDN